MKKFITAAALIAASTALANAATVLTTTFSNAAQTSATAVTLTNATEITAVTAGTASVTAGTNLATTGTVGADATFYSPNANVGNGTSWNATFSYSGVSGITQIDSLTLDVGLFTSSGGWQSNSVTRSINFSAVVKSGETTLGTYSVSDYSITGNGTKTTATVVLSGNTLSFANVSDFTVELTVAPGTSTGGGTYVGLNSVAFSGSAVPEPSAFGLLAGIGALALAVSRRRRSR